jgi:hypothetical protein
VNSRQPRNIAASVRQRLMNLSRERGEEFQLVLTRYGLERLLYRLAQSPHAEQFVLKGAALFQLWTGQPHRSTRDLDLLGQGEPSTDRPRQLFQEVCSLTVDDDGLTFLTDAIQAEQIKEDVSIKGFGCGSRLVSAMPASPCKSTSDSGMPSRRDRRRSPIRRCSTSRRLS